MLISASDLKNNFGKYLKYVTDENGEIVITKNNTRVARLVPFVSDIERYFTIREHAAEYGDGRKTISYEEFLRIYEKSRTRMEFINGELIIMESPSFTHQRLLGDLHILFNQYFADKKCLPMLAPFDVIFKKQDIKDPDVLQPDLVVICDPDQVNARDRYLGTPSLTLEILSPGTRSRDMILKLNTYMTAGVSEYWIVDPTIGRIMIYSFKDLQYDHMSTFEKGSVARSIQFEGLAIDIDKLFAKGSTYSR